MRSVALLTIVLLAPLPAGQAARESIDPSDLLEIELEDIAPLPQDGAWRVEEAGPPLRLHARAQDGLAPARVELPIGGIEAFGYEARVTGGELRLLVDGEVVTTLGRGEHVRDVALWTGDEALAWEFVPSALTDQVWLALKGARPLLAPVLQYVSSTLYSWCGEDPMFYVQLRYALPLGLEDVLLRINEEIVEATVQQGIVGDQRAQWIYFPLPFSPEGTVESVDLLVRDVLGKAWELLADKTMVHRVGNYVHGEPHGWVYETRPPVRLIAPCAETPFASHRLLVDGEDVTDQVEREAEALVYRFQEDLAYGEPHTWRYEIAVRGADPLVREGTFRVALDTLELDVPSLALVWTEARREGTGAGTHQVFADLADPSALPPVVAARRAPLVAGLDPIVLPEGATLRAVYVPHALRCTSAAGTCDPYGGDAPGFHGDVVRVAELTIIDRHGRSLTLPGAGQFAAASAASDPYGHASQLVEGRRAWAKGLVEAALGETDAWAGIAAEDVEWAWGLAQKRLGEA